MGVGDGVGMLIGGVFDCSDILDVADADGVGMLMDGAPVCGAMVGAIEASLPHPANSYTVFEPVVLSVTVNFTGTGTLGATQYVYCDPPELPVYCVAV